MEIFVLDKDFNSVHVLDEFESAIWTDRYQKAGDFELYLPMQSYLLNYLMLDYYLWIANSEHIMIVEQINITSDTESGNNLIVSGRSAESILDRRIIWTQTILKGNLQDAVRTLLYNNVISPTISDRKIDNFIFEESTDERITSLTIEAQYTGDNLYDVIVSICEQKNIGFKIYLNDSNQLVFTLYVGEDRSYDQTTNPYVIFSPEFENIINSNYLESKQSLKTVTLVAGEGEGASRRTTVVGSGSGLDRRELYTDARDISSDVGNDIILTDKEYINELKQRGTEKLAENITTTAFEGEVEATQMFKYGEDFFVGDIVQIANEYGHEGKVYISEFVISQNNEGTSMYPTFTNVEEGDE